MHARHAVCGKRSPRFRITSRLVRGSVRLLGARAHLDGYGQRQICLSGMAARRVLPQSDLLLAADNVLVVGLGRAERNRCHVLQWQWALLQRRCGVEELVLLWRTWQGSVRMQVSALGWLLVTALMLLPGWHAGGAVQAAVVEHGRAGLGARCLEDTECQSDFCDRQRCA